MHFDKVSFEEAKSDYAKSGQKHFVSADEQIDWIEMGNYRLDDKLNELKMPERSTEGSAGYDFFMPYNVIIHPNCSVRFPLLVKCSDMPKNIVLLIFNRSSMALSKGISLDNAVGVIDSDYDKDIWFQATNRSSSDVFLKQGDKICQGIFIPYVTIEEDNHKAKRKGGIGSTGR